jgi:uncharacterized HhH-GPD family protein
VRVTRPSIPITDSDEANQLLVTDPMALLIGMLLDQQVPMTWAFRGPQTLLDRLGTIDAAALAALDPEELVATFSTKPALHRYPASMARRTHELCAFVTERYGGDPAEIWRGARSAEVVLDRLRELPGFGDEKAKILLAVLAKRFGRRPAGWERAAAPFSDDQPRSVADVDSIEGLARVRAWKQEAKAAGRSKAD